MYFLIDRQNLYPYILITLNIIDALFVNKPLLKIIVLSSSLIKIKIFLENILEKGAQGEFD